MKYPSFFIALTFSLFCCSRVFGSQLAARDSLQAGTITGYVYDQVKKPLEYSSVQLLRAKDSSLVKSSLSDSSGKYTFNRIANGTYIVKVLQLGYESAYGTVFNMQSSSIHLNAVVLRVLPNQLTQVNVTAKKPLIERRIDRTVLNVANSILASGGSINELLEVAPGVSIDNNQITMKGKQGVIVMIDDKQVKLSASQITALLQSMPANSIDKIELITSPSAKYDAEGKGGIINIKTKKNSSPGFNGTVTSGFIVGVNPRFNESLNLNYKVGKLNIFSNYSYQHLKQESEYFSDKTVTAAERLKYNQDELGHNLSVSHNARLGADYLLNDKNTIGVLGTLNTNANRSDFTQHTVFRDFNSGKIDSSLSSVNNGKSRYDTYGINLNAKHIFGPDDHVLLFNADYTSYRSQNLNTYLNSYFNGNGESSRDAETVLNRSVINIDLLTAKVDYTYPINENAKFEAGAKVAYTHSNSNILFQKQDGEGQLFTDMNRTNTFDYKENINAGYINYSAKLGKSTSLQLGLRGEQTNYNGSSLTTGEKFDRSYLQLFPSLFLLRTFGNDQVSFSYNRRIGRPGYEDLNPFIDYVSPYFYTQGNPLLKPETTHAVEINYVFKEDMSISLGYSTTKDYFNYFTSLADSTGATRQTVQNFKNFNTLTFSVSYSKELLSVWNMTANGDFFYDRYKTPILDTFIDIKQAGYNLNLLNELKATDKLSFELLGLFKSKRVVLTRRIDSKYRADAGVKYTVLKKMGTVKFGMTDIFYSYINKGVNETSGLYSTFYNKNENRRFNINLTYKFGGKPSVSRQDQSNKEELERIKN